MDIHGLKWIDCSNTSLRRVLAQGVRISKGVLEQLF